MSMRYASEETKTLFLILFTKELIKNSRKTESLEGLLQRDRKLTEEIKHIVEKREQIKKEKRLPAPIQHFPRIKKRILFRRQKRPALLPKIRRRTPMRKPLSIELGQELPKLPHTLQKIRPVPTMTRIDLGKLNPLIRDLTVTAIECSGPGKNIIVRRGNEKRITRIILSKEEIEDIIQKFSQASKIPAEEGFLKVAVGNLMISAIHSDIINSRFIITKLI